MSAVLPLTPTAVTVLIMWRRFVPRVAAVYESPGLLSFVYLLLTTPELRY